MKALLKKIVFLNLFIMAFAVSTSADATGKKVTEEFKVFGNCEMCKEKIENALQVKGVYFAEWNVETKILTVTFNPDKITLDEIHKKINEIGYDTEKSKATNEDNAKLPHCCQRKGEH